jgi:hypothetical protein
LPQKVIDAFQRKLEEYKKLPEEELRKMFESDKLSKTYKMAILAALRDVKQLAETKQSNAIESTGNNPNTGSTENRDNSI